MKAIKLTLLSVLLTLSTLAFADQAAEREAEKLLDSMGLEQILQQSMQQMLAIQIQNNPSIAPYKEVMTKFFNKHMSYESLKPDLIKIYANAFSASELKEINEFYSTPVGKKTLQKMPALMQQGGQLGAARVQQNMGELQAMIQEENKRIQAEKNN